ncbi:MAG TPA: DUF3305 domain-containing protein [Geminicoccaceae bacterium]
MTVERSASMPLGVVIERRALDNPWQQWRWRPVAVLPGAAVVEDWRELMRGGGWVRWHAATLPLVLHRKETEAYRANLSGRLPVIYVVLRKTAPSAATAGKEFKPFLVTASPYEAEGYLESGEEIVEGVAMPPVLLGWVQAFIDRHHVDEPFVKRKRKRDKGEEPPGAQSPGQGAPVLRRRGFDV